jgi:outer membrane protein assembly factor BamB
MNSWLMRGVCVLAVACLAAKPTGDWPQFRGPTEQGISQAKNLPTTWSPDEHVAWKTEIPGRGWSSPVVQDGKVYLTTAVPASDEKNAPQELRALCLDLKGGKVLWNIKVFDQAAGQAMHGKNTHASPTPIVEGDRVYVHFGPHGTAALDLQGKVVWSKKIKYSPVHGNGGSPVLVDGKLIFSCDGGSENFMIALNAKDGEEAWRTPREVDMPKRFSFSTPLVLTLDGKTQIVSPGTGAVMSYDPATGRELWKVRYDGYSVIPCPVYANGLIYLSSGYDNPVLYAIRPGGEGDVTDSHIAWKITKGAPNTPSPLAIGTELYLVSDGGVATCLDGETGKQIWQKRVGGNYSASPVFGDGKIYFQSEQGEATVIEASREYQELAKNNLGEPSLASYAIIPGALLIRTDKHLWRIQN